MASRENTGLHAAVIVLAIFFLISIVGMVLLNNARKTQFARAESANAAAGDANGKMAAMQAEMTEMKRRMGFQEGDTAEAVAAAVDAIMARYPEMAEENRNFKAVLEMVSEERNKLVLNLGSATEEIKTLKDRLLAVESQKEEQVKKFQAEMEQVRADAAKARTDFTDDRARMTSENEGYQKKLAELQTAHDEAIAKLDGEKSDLETQIIKLRESVEKLRLGLPDVDQFAQPADGRIIGDEQGFATVTINLGSADGLRPQVTFKVSDAGLDDAAAAETKGSIEVTRILGPHMAEAKITSDAAVNPLLRGDRIYSQVWDRGRQVGFGIAGIIDIDGDGKSDLDRLKSIIGASGGVIDAAPDDKGAQQGNLKVTTRYLILGEYPTDGRRAAFQTSWNDLKEEAETLGIETIAVGEFLSLMGWKSETRSVAFGAGARAEDFPATPLEQELPRPSGQPAGVFKKRLPTSTY